MHNFTLKRNAENYLSRMQPIANALDKLQHNSCTISDSVAVWHKMEEDLSSAPIDVAKKMYHRQNQTLTPAHSLAHLLDPRYQA